MDYHLLVVVDEKITEDGQDAVDGGGDVVVTSIGVVSVTFAVFETENETVLRG
jgi:hypothetical protein